MGAYSKVSNEELNDYITGKSAQVGSPAYYEARLEYAERQRKIDFTKAKKDLDRLITAINGLAENWKEKVFWFIVVALFVSIAANVLGALIVNKLLFFI